MKFDQHLADAINPSLSGKISVNHYPQMSDIPFRTFATEITAVRSTSLKVICNCQGKL